MPTFSHLCHKCLPVYIDTFIADIFLFVSLVFSSINRRIIVLYYVVSLSIPFRLLHFYFYIHPVSYAVGLSYSFTQIIFAAITDDVIWTYDTYIMEDNSKVEVLLDALLDTTSQFFISVLLLFQYRKQHCMSQMLVELEENAVDDGIAATARNGSRSKGRQAKKAVKGKAATKKGESSNAAAGRENKMSDSLEGSPAGELFVVQLVDRSALHYHLGSFCLLANT